MQNVADKMLTINLTGQKSVKLINGAGDGKQIWGRPNNRRLHRVPNRRGAFPRILCLQLKGYMLEAVLVPEHESNAPEDRLHLFFSTHDVTLTDWRLRPWSTCSAKARSPAPVHWTCATLRSTKSRPSAPASKSPWSRKADFLACRTRLNHQGPIILSIVQYVTMAIK